MEFESNGVKYILRNELTVPEFDAWQKCQMSNDVLTLSKNVGEVESQLKLMDLMMPAVKEIMKTLVLEPKGLDVVNTPAKLQMFCFVYIGKLFRETLEVIGDAVNSSSKKN